MANQTPCSFHHRGITGWMAMTDFVAYFDTSGSEADINSMPEKKDSVHDTFRPVVELGDRGQKAFKRFHDAVAPFGDSTARTPA
jgi:hypothetical protein